MNQEVTDYINGYSGIVRDKLMEMRTCIHNLVPEAEELMNYGIPTLKLKGKNLVHFAGYNSHIGFYPGSGAIAEFENRLMDYKTSKGTVQLPIDKPLPLELVKDMTLYRQQQILNK